MTTAVLIVDVQQALCSGKYEAFESRRVIACINQVSRMAREAGAPIVIIQHESDGGLLDYATDGWKLAPGLDAMPTDIYVRKKAADSFHNTELQAVLQARGITSLVIPLACKASSVWTRQLAVRWHLGIPSRWCRMAIPLWTTASWPQRKSPRITT